jgi:thioredoxin 1
MERCRKINEEDFQSEVLDSKIPVVVDFFADWCGPCKSIAPILENIAKDYQDRVKVVKLDVDQAGATTAKFGISSIPTIIYFKGGKEVSRTIGTASKKEFIDQIEKLL